jgi:hypothetical protein
MGRRVRFAGALAATSALLSACGGSSSSDQTANFKTSFTPVVHQLKSTSQAIGRAVEGAGSQTDAQIATTFGDLANRWQTQVNALQPLKPPASVGTAFTTLKRAATRAEADLNGIVSAAHTHSAPAARRASANMVIDIAAAKSAATTVTDKLGIK